MADDLITSAIGRFIALGGLAGRVGMSTLGSRLVGLVQSDDARAARRAELLVRNATRAVETLGQMKGAAMKVGQMLSLHGDLLPPEVAAVLRTLQQDAPKVPGEVMQEEARAALPDFDALFRSLDEEPLAAASIGQVHRGVLKDGRNVVVKIQYPLIDEVIKADLRNMKTVMHGLFAVFTDVEFDPIWEELRDRLFEELDYTREAASMEAEAALGEVDIVVPRVIREASAKRVLTMEYRPGISPERACSGAYPQELRDRWGRVLVEWQLRGLFERLRLHADPNLSNFAFLEDGRVVVYDFGCIKDVPPALAQGYARLALAVVEGRHEEIPDILFAMGVTREDGTKVSAGLTGPYAAMYAEIVREAPPYTFGEDTELYQRMIQLAVANFGEASTLRFPRDVVFINRTLGGHYGNLARLRATGPWRSIIEQHARRAI